MCVFQKKLLKGSGSGRRNLFLPSCFFSFLQFAVMAGVPAVILNYKVLLSVGVISNRKRGTSIPLLTVNQPYSLRLPTSDIFHVREKINLYSIMLLLFGVFPCATKEIKLQIEEKFTGL